jgi:hypothetical protein
MDYQVVIPTYKRTETLLKKTLATLLNTNLRMTDDNFHIFVADQEEAQAYMNALDGIVHPGCIKVGLRGIPNQRNFIQQYFPEGTPILMVDDDISKLHYYTPDGKSAKLHDADRFVREAFGLTEKFGLHLWGVNANTNPLNMQHQISVGLIYLVGNFIGLINTHNPRTFVDTGDAIKSRATFAAGKESHERVLKHYLLYGGVLKFKNIGVESAYWKEPGGHQESRTTHGEMDATKYLLNKYPSLTKYRDFNGVPDLQLRTGKTKTYPYNFYQKEANLLDN